MEILGIVGTILGILGISIISSFQYIVGKFLPRLRWWWINKRSGGAMNDGIILGVYRKRDTSDSRTDIERFVSNNKNLKNIKDNGRLFYETPAFIQPGDLDRIISNVQVSLKLALGKATSKTIHVILDTTIVLGVLLIAPYYNTASIQMYHFNSITGTYEWQGPLKRNFD